MTGANKDSLPIRPAEPVDPAGPQSRSLGEALQRFGIALDPEKVEVLDAYREALWKWNEKMSRSAWKMSRVHWPATA